MRPSTFFLTLVLGLLPSLIVASTDNVGADSIPILSTVDGPFALRVQNQFSVVLRYQAEISSYVPVITRSRIRRPEFTLQEGNLTTSDKSLAAYLGPVPLIFPPPLTPIRFGKGVDRLQANFVAVTRPDQESGKPVLELFALGGLPVVRSLNEGEAIYQRPEGSITPFVRLHIVLEPIKSSANCVDNNEMYDQEFLDSFDLK